MKTISKHGLFALALAALLSPLLGACGKQDMPGQTDYVVPEGMVEVRPELGPVFGYLPRPASDGTRATELGTNKTERLSEGSTVWLIARSVEGSTVTYTKRSYVVYNSGNDPTMSYLVPCAVDSKGKVLEMNGAPLFLRKGSYTFYAISPARELKLVDGSVGFNVNNGEAFYANDARYVETGAKTINVGEGADNTEAVQRIDLNPMINQTAQLRFKIQRGKNVHDLGIQPAGIQVSGLQEDHDGVGVPWTMAVNDTDTPFVMKHSEQTDSFRTYDYYIEDGEVYIDVPILPMYATSKPVIVVLRLKVNGVPTAFEMMLNEKNFMAGHSYGYRGTVNVEDGVTVISWQFVNWDTEVAFPDFTKSVL